MGIKKFFEDGGNILAFAIGLIPTIALYIFQPDASVSFHIFAILFFLFLISLWVCIKFAIDLNEKKRYIQELESSIKNYQSASTLQIVECHHNVCICKPNGLISQNSLVTFYEKMRGYENQIGYGFVEVINSANLAQIKVIPCSEDIPDLMQHINDHRDSTIVRSTISLNDVEKIKQYYL